MELERKEGKDTRGTLSAWDSLRYLSKTRVTQIKNKIEKKIFIDRGRVN